MFNSALFHRLYGLVQVRRGDVLRVLNVRPTTYDYWYQKNDMPLVALLSVCNMLYVSVSSFIIPETDHPPLVLHENYTESSFMPVDMGDWISMRHTVREATRVLGYGSPRSFYRHYRSDVPSSLTVSQYIEHCNRLHLYPGSFITDSDIVLLDGFTSPDLYSHL